ncbi:MAG TPA: tetratricopeptide repeat protein, partial [Roseiflexaceae bacterium]|nr:tetratricopeptide repeat protein [Roseiflexaceae bacterium]
LEQAIAEALEWSKAATNTAEIPQPRQPPPTNLPAPPTRLIGRERELADLGALPRRAEVRLVTLTGAGGSGKTRLALELAADLRDVFPDGVFLVELAPVRQADLVAATIATTLGLKDAGAQPLLERLSAHLHDRHLLLLLDNFEHVLEAGPLLATLLAACPSLKLLITSRAPLHLRGEREVEVAPLALPDLRQPPDLDPRAQAPAVRLFVARVQDVRPDFRLTQENAASVNEICVRLDGLPLALELAARRVKVLSPPSLLDRLRSRLQVLTSGAQDLPARQRTMRAAIDWSYSLLAPDMQALFARLGAFVGGCTIEAAEAICSAGGEPDTAVLDGLQTLVDQSLLQCIEGPAGESRFLMLETIREYALEQLAASGELQALQRRHAEYFLALAQAAEPELRGPQQVRWLDRLEVEQPNLRAALAWSLQAEDNGQRTELGLHLAVALGEFWTRRGYLSEGREWLAYAVSRTEAGGASGPSTVAHCALRAKALKQFAQLAHRQGDLDAARSALQQSLALFQELGDTKEIASALSLLGMQFQMQGEYRRAEALLAESLTLAREIGDTHRISWCLFFLGTVAYAEGNVRQAGEVWEESLTRLRAQGDSWGIALLLTHIGMVAVDQGDYARVGAYLAEGLTLLRELGDRWQTALALEACASLAAQTQRDGHAQMGALRAARLFGAVEMFRETLGAPLLPIYRDHYQRGLAAARALLDQAAFAAAWEEGRAMTLEQAIAEALAALQDEPPSKQMR